MPRNPTLLLDLGGVIYLTNEWYEETLYETAARHLRALGADATPDSVRRVMDTWRLDVSVQQSIVYAAAVLLAEHGLTPTPSRAEALARVLQSAVLSGVYVAPGTYELLRWAKRNGILVGIVSNNWCYECVRLLLERDDLAHLVDTVVTSDIVGFCKPHTKIYEAAMQLLRADPAKTAFIDDYEPNVEGARRAGIGLAIHHDGKPLDHYIPVLERFYSSR
ncbi:HAD-superfamily hydrolase, subfamily IA, variant 3 [Pyrolobus fumarii 1A]|uniref:HAD-superfamily hydrolase, subfamily IA, variant 3 n=1 Tax=Pyrolobus fumarii (strain DSM 11204 / 1A) TaxID=694429 RepID=G0EDC7_PYRF1|nr:HAD-IA family hydrolase [Pyrolobus fumarii]AEM38612.1 HAD-superfamily hydrolase, subfamily IA, variant 3 [Pyrolobus fumarii 1A]